MGTWRQLEYKAFERHILPHFTDLLLQSEISCRDFGEVVAKIILLLAIDSLGADLDGSFYCVGSFLGALSESDPNVECDGKSYRMKVDLWKYRWGGWLMRFSHFVELTRDTNEANAVVFTVSACRRGAASWHNGAHFIVPMFCRNKVSYILFRINNKDSRDTAYATSATTKLTPQHVFGKQHELGCRPKTWLECT